VKVIAPISSTLKAKDELIGRAKQHNSAPLKSLKTPSHVARPGLPLILHGRREMTFTKRVNKISP